MHASTWASAGLGVALGGFGRRGGLGSLVVSLVGAWGACGGPGERRADGVRVFSANAQHDIQEAPPSNQIESPGAFLRLQVHESRHRKRNVPLADTTGRNLGLKITTQRNPRCQRLAPHNSNPPPIFARNDLRYNASQPTCRGSALDRSALGDFKATQQEILGSNNLQGKRRTIST